MSGEALTSDELIRYARQIGPGVLSEKAQLRLKNSAALIARVGGMGGPAALEAIKILSGAGKPTFGKLWMIDSYNAHTSVVELKRDPNCPCCGSKA